METKVLPINEIEFDESLYPRQGYWWATAYTYSQEMKAGAKFPNITIWYCNGKPILLDGKHRWEAYRLNKETHVTCNVLSRLTREQAFVKAVELNIANGQSLSPYDKMKIIKKLEDMKFDMETISKIVQIPFTSISQFIAKRITLNPAGGQQILKAPLMHLSENQVIVSDEDQDKLSGNSEMSMLNQMIQIFENRNLIRTDDEFLGKLSILYGLISDFISSKSIQNKFEKKKKNDAEKMKAREAKKVKSKAKAKKKK